MNKKKTTPEVDAGKAWYVAIDDIHAHINGREIIADVEDRIQLNEVEYRNLKHLVKPE
jgi:hypothetical protein